MWAHQLNQPLSADATLVFRYKIPIWCNRRLINCPENQTATFAQTKPGWKAVARRIGLPTQAKSFRTKREAEEWSRQIEVEMTRRVFVDRAGNTKMNLAEALAQYQSSATVKKKASTKASTQKVEIGRVKSLTEDPGRYALTSITPQVVAKYRDQLTAAGLAPDAVRLWLQPCCVTYLGVCHCPASQGLTIFSPAASKGLMSRVATMKPHAMAVAAI